MSGGACGRQRIGQSVGNGDSRSGASGNAPWTGTDLSIGAATQTVAIGAQGAAAEVIRAASVRERDAATPTLFFTLVGARELNYLTGNQGWCAVCREGCGCQEGSYGEELMHAVE